jgi:spermidine synthase
VRGTLRYQGFPEFIKALVDIGFLSAEEKGWLKEGEIKWREITKRAVGAESSDER